MSLRKLRETLAGTLLPPEAEDAITSAEKKEREDASYTDYLEMRLKSVLGEQTDGQEGQTSALRKEWEQSKGKPQSSHVQSLAFDQSTGTYIDPNSPIRYCQVCRDAHNRKGPLKEEAHGWYCGLCKRHFADPARPRPSVTWGRPLA